MKDDPKPDEEETEAPKGTTLHFVLGPDAPTATEFALGTENPEGRDLDPDGYLRSLCEKAGSIMPGLVGLRIDEGARIRAAGGTGVEAEMAFVFALRLFRNLSVALTHLPQSVVESIEHIVDAGKLSKVTRRPEGMN